MSLPGAYHPIFSGKHGGGEGSLRRTNRPRRDPMVIAMEKQYRASYQYKLDKLVRLERLFLKRETLARKGLRKTRRQIMELLTKLAADKLPNKVEDK